MSEFDKIIGYEPIKQELRQLCDMMHNMDVYEKLGAKMPKGLLLHGKPGVGKSFMARVFVRESGRKSYIVRRSKPDGDFVNEIKNVFTQADQNTPSVILLDDMDKFAVDEDSNEEYVAVQACIDEVAFSDVYVIATANELDGIPDSLLRAGRFDRKINVRSPKGEDAAKIIMHYMAPKSVACNLNIDDIAKMMNGCSCAELETILNEAAIYAGFERCESISMEHFVHSVLRIQYGTSDSFMAVDSKHLEKTACHEAGHVVVAETLCPNSIGLASVRTRLRGEYAGFVINCCDWKDLSYNMLMLMAGKAATEIKCGAVDNGAGEDLNRAIREMTESIACIGSFGMGMLDVFEHYEKPSNMLRARQEAVIQAEVERYFQQAKELLVKNMAFLDAVAAALLEKKTLLSSDIQKIKKACVKGVNESI